MTTCIRSNLSWINLNWTKFKINFNNRTQQICKQVTYVCSMPFNQFALGWESTKMINLCFCQAKLKFFFCVLECFCLVYGSYYSYCLVPTVIYYLLLLFFAGMCCEHANVYVSVVFVFKMINNERQRQTITQFYFILFIKSRW